MVVLKIQWREKKQVCIIKHPPVMRETQIGCPFPADDLLMILSRGGPVFSQGADKFASPRLTTSKETLHKSRAIRVAACPQGPVTEYKKIDQPKNYNHTPVSQRFTSIPAASPPARQRWKVREAGSLFSKKPASSCWFSSSSRNLLHWSSLSFSKRAKRPPTNWTLSSSEKLFSGTDSSSSSSIPRPMLTEGSSEAEAEAQATRFRKRWGRLLFPSACLLCCLAQPLTLLAVHLLYQDLLSQVASCVCQLPLKRGGGVLLPWGQQKSSPGHPQPPLKGTNHAFSQLGPHLLREEPLAAATPGAKRRL